MAYIYIMANSGNKGWVKVGFTERNVEARRAELSSATGVLAPFNVLHVFEVPPGLGKEAERRAHRVLGCFHRKKEFFRCSAELACAKIREELSEFDNYRHVDVRLIKESINFYWKERQVWQQIRESCESICRRELEDAEVRFSRAVNKERSRISEESEDVFYWHRLAKIMVLGCFLSLLGALGGVPAALIGLAVPFFWTPRIFVKWFPTAADELPEFQFIMKDLEKELCERRKKISNRRAEQELGIQASLTAYLNKQREGEKLLRSMGLSSRFT